MGFDSEALRFLSSLTKFLGPSVFLVPQGDGSFILRVLHATLQTGVRLI